MTSSPANDTVPAAKAPAKITVWEIRSKDRKSFGRVYPGEVTPNHHAEIVPGVSIRLFGMTTPGRRYIKDESGARTVETEGIRLNPRV